MRLGCALRGRGDIEIRGVAGIEDAGPDQVTFLANPRYAQHLARSKAGAVIVAADVDCPLPSLVTDNPYLAYAQGSHTAAATEPPKSGGPSVSASGSIGNRGRRGHR